jgi:hypothetical protein
MRRVLPPAHATFSASGQTITFATTVPASLSHILRVVNLTRSVVYFNPTGESGLGEAGTASYNSPVLTIKINTQKHANTDELFIEYDDGLGHSTTTLTGPVTVSNEVEIKNEEGSPVPVLASVAARTPTTVSVASSISSVALVGVNSNRKGLLISNISTSKLYLSFSSTATVANSFVELEPGKFLLFDQQLIVGSAITGIWLSANGSAQVTEFI